MQQADSAHSATGALASSGNIENHSATRRGILTAFATLPAIALASPITALSTPMPSDLEAAWQCAMVEYQKAEAEENRYELVWRPKYDAWKAGNPDRGTVNWNDLRGISPADPGTYSNLNVPAESEKLRRHIEQGYWRHDLDRAHRRLKALDQLEQWQADTAANRLRHDFDNVMARSERLSEHRLDCEAALMRTPAPDMAALLWKLDLLLMIEDGETSAWSAKFAEQTLLDARRLAA